MSLASTMLGTFLDLNQRAVRLTKMTYYHSRDGIIIVIPSHDEVDPTQRLLDPITCSVGRSAAQSKEALGVVIQPSAETPGWAPARVIVNSLLQPPVGVYLNCIW